MARKGIAPLSTTIAWAFTSGSSTTNQRPKPKKITATRTKPPPPLMESKRKARERERETTTGLSGVAIGESAHAIPPRRSGQSVAGEGARRALPALGGWSKLRGQRREHPPLSD